MGLFVKMKSDLTSALKAKSTDTVGVLRMAMAAIKDLQIQEGTRDREPSDEALLGVINRMVKQRRESVEQYRNGGREDLASKEEAEISVLSNYLPQQLSDDELSSLITATIAELGASGPKDMGQVMKALMPKVTGRADGKLVSQKVSALLK